MCVGACAYVHVSVCLYHVRANQTEHRLQSGDDDLYGPAISATNVSLRTCHRLQTAAVTAVVWEGSAGRVQNEDTDRVACKPKTKTLIVSRAFSSASPNVWSSLPHSGVQRHPLRHSKVVSRHSCLTSPTMTINDHFRRLSLVAEKQG